MRRINLIGLPCAGATSIARQLATNLGLTCYSFDASNEAIRRKGLMSLPADNVIFDASCWLFGLGGTFNILLLCDELVRVERMQAKLGGIGFGAAEDPVERREMLQAEYFLETYSVYAHWLRPDVYERRMFPVDLVIHTTRITVEQACREIVLRLPIEVAA